MNVNSPYVNRTPVNVNGLGVNGILVNVSDPNVDENQTNWTLPHNDFPHYQISFLGYLGPFSSAYLLLPTLNLSSVCVIAQVPYLSRQIARAQKHRTLSDEFGTTPFQGRTASSYPQSLSSRLLCLYSRQVDPREDPTEPLSAKLPKCLSNIFPSVSLN